MNEKRKAINQIKHLNLVQRSPDGKILMFFHCGDDRRETFDAKNKLSTDDKDEIKYRFEFHIPDGQKIAGVIFVTSGWISSMECKLRPERCVKKDIKVYDLGTELELSKSK